MGFEGNAPESHQISGKVLVLLHANYVTTPRSGYEKNSVTKTYRDIKRKI